MSEQLKEQLMKGYGLTDEQITGVENLGVSTVEDMQFVTAEDLTGLGVKVIVARKIVAAFAPKPAEVPTTSQPSGPINVTVQSGKLVDKPLKELLDMLASGERSTELKQAIREKIGGLVCFVRVEDGENLDVAATLECYDYVLETSQSPEMWGNVPVESFEEILEKRREADPLTGDALTNGVNPTTGLSWKPVSEQNRVYIAFARLNNLLEGRPDPFVLVDELSKEPLGGRWIKIVAVYKRAEKAEPEKIAAARAALWYRKGGRSGSGTRPFRRSDSRLEV